VKGHTHTHRHRHTHTQNTQAHTGTHTETHTQTHTETHTHRYKNYKFTVFMVEEPERDHLKDKGENWRNILNIY
jgi:hypothetical protein